MVEVECNSILQIIQEQGVLRAVRQHLPDVNPIGKEQHRLWPQSFAAALVRTKLIALLTPALEATLTVGAALAAVTLLSTFIHILT